MRHHAARDESQIFLTAAITCAGVTQDKSHLVPRSSEQIATAAIDTAKAEAAIAHCHVHDADTDVPDLDSV